MDLRLVSGRPYREYGRTLVNQLGARCSVRCGGLHLPLRYWCQVPHATNPDGSRTLRAPRHNRCAAPVGVAPLVSSNSCAFTDSP